MAGGCAAFTLVKGGQTRLIVLAELTREKTRSLKRSGDPESQTHDIIDAIRESIAREHDISAHIVRLVPQGTLPRTTSGKLRRNHCREMFLENVLKNIG